MNPTSGFERSRERGVGARVNKRIPQLGATRTGLRCERVVPRPNQQTRSAGESTVPRAASEDRRGPVEAPEGQISVRQTADAFYCRDDQPFPKTTRRKISIPADKVKAGRHPAPEANAACSTATGKETASMEVLGTLAAAATQRADQPSPSFSLPPLSAAPHVPSPSSHVESR
jgi:hypothetical protein